MRISDWSSDVCSSDLLGIVRLIENRAQYLVASPAAGRHRQTDGLEGHEAAVQIVQRSGGAQRLLPFADPGQDFVIVASEIGRASCRARVCQYVYISVVSVALK